MLQTLLKIGEWNGQSKGPWERFLEKPKMFTKDKKGNPIANYVLPIVFDLDKMEVVIDSKLLRDYDDSLLEPLKALKIQGGNNKSIYATVPSSNLIQLYKTFFGKEHSKTSEGEISEAIRKVDPSLMTPSFERLLRKIFALKESFLDLSTIRDDKTNKRQVSFKAIENKLSLARNEAIPLVYIAIKDSEYAFDHGQPFGGIPEYIELLKYKFHAPRIPLASDGTAKRPQKLCYASGHYLDDVQELKLSERYSLNKMFVTETRNYASQFDKDRFRLNYQVSKVNQEKLDHASKYLLNEGFKARIAGIDHVIIPQFLDYEKVDLDFALRGIKIRSDILFGLEALEHAVKDMRDETTSPFFLNFIGFESDGNFFKSTEIIKDVSDFHFQRIIDAFRAVHWELKAERFVDWESVMAEYGRTGRFFNLNTIYAQIPLRKEKEKKNKALHLFKIILENRKPQRSILFEYFCELILCHFYERYRSYTNIAESSKDYFGKTVRDCVFKYIGFIKVLTKLKLLDMETSVITTNEPVNRYEKAINDFFAKMQLTQEQQAMFYLGRMLNTVEFIQKEKKKTVIDKVNFNGMDKEDIQRLRIALVEKAKQYKQLHKVILSDRRFGELFDLNAWQLNPNESVFFLLTGYSFGLSVPDVTELEKKNED